MPPGESSCPGGLEDVWQRGVEGTSGRLTLTGSRSLLYFPKKREAYLSHCKKVYLPQFRKLSLTNFQNCGRYTFLLRLIILLTDRILSHSPNLGDQNRVKHLLYPPFIYICCCLTWVLLTLNIILLEMKTFTLNYLRLLIQLANKSQLWIYSNFHFQRKCCQKWSSHENVSWFFINCNSNGRNFYFWFDWDFYQLIFSKSPNTPT